MTTQIVLMRGVNLGAANRIAMADLRSALSAQGFTGVRTHLQSGNVLADGDGERLVAAIRAVIDVPCVARSAEELDAAIAANPFGELAADSPKLVQVTFHDGPAGEALLSTLSGSVRGEERFAANGREVYSWHPAGLARSKLALALTPAGANATARNWNTVVKLAELAHA